jgi:hypothetical protein
MIDGQETGPLTRVELGVELASGAITPENLVWKQGMVNWIPGAKVPELAALFKNPPRSPRAAGARPPPPPKKQEKGMGLGEFDTAHFRLADLAPEDTGSSRNLEFDTAHFKLAELKAEDDGQSRQMEFDTAHFRLQDLKGGQGARALVPKRIVPQGMETPPEVPAPPRSPGQGGPRTTLKQASTAAVKQSSPVGVRQMPPPVAAEPPMAKATQRPSLKPATAPPSAARAAPRPAPRPPEKGDSDFDPAATSVDFRTLGQLVSNQQKAQSLFETEIVPDEAPIVDEPPPPATDPHVAALSKWAHSEMESGAKEDARHPATPKKTPLPPPPVPVAPPPEKSYAPLAIGLAAALVIACAILWFMLSD